MKKDYMKDNNLEVEEDIEVEGDTDISKKCSLSNSYFNL
jgi:hypothetical protein